jgi:hypothetical protein
MNRLQQQLIDNTADLPGKLLQEIVDFSEFIKKKFQGQAFKKRIEKSEQDISQGRIKEVTPQELYKELEI